MSRKVIPMSRSGLLCSLFSLLLLLSAMACQKTECALHPNEALIGTWTGKVTQTIYEDGVLSSEDISNATIEFRSDYSGKSTLIHLLEGLVPIYTTEKEFHYTYMEELRILDLVTSLSTEDNPALSSDYSEAYDVKQLDETQLVASYEHSSITVEGTRMEFYTYWELEKEEE